MWNLLKLSFILSICAFNLISAERQVPYQPVAALFGPKNKFICNAVVLARGRVLINADCLFLKKNKTYSVGKPEEFHVALETNSIEQFQNGKAFAKGSKWKYLAKLSQKFGVKYDNKFSNQLFSDSLKPEEEKYLLKAMRSSGVKPNGRNHYIQVLNFTLHPKFKAPFSNDLAVLDIPDTNPVNDTSIIEKSNVNVDSAYNRVVQVHGYGILSHGANETNRTAYFKVRTVEMYLLPPARCQLGLRDLFQTNQHICLLPKSNETLCFGFTGAPIVLEGKLIGIVEFGHYSCGLESPVVGIRLDAFEDFLGLGSFGFLHHLRQFAANLMRRLMGARV